VIVTVVLAVLVAAGALGAAGVIRWRAAHAASTPTTSTKPPPTGVFECQIEPCHSLVKTTVGGTQVELWADDGAHSGRLRVGGTTAGSGSVIEATITDQGVVLTPDSLQCVAGGPAACLIKGEHDGGVAGQVVVGRSDKWSLTEGTYISDAGYLVLSNINGDSAPEILAAQHSGSAFFMQVFSIAGTMLGCTKDYPKLDKLPGYGNNNPKLTEALLAPCR
jgi:hypothetical protein